MAPHQDVFDAESDLPLTEKILESVLDSKFPAENKDGKRETYEELLEDLNHFGVQTNGLLISLLDAHYEQIMSEDRHQHRTIARESRMKRRQDLNCYFTHVGLARAALRIKFGEAYGDYQVVAMSERRERKRRERLSRRSQRQSNLAGDTKTMPAVSS